MSWNRDRCYCDQCEGRIPDEPVYDEPEPIVDPFELELVDGAAYVFMLVPTKCGLCDGVIERGPTWWDNIDDGGATHPMCWLDELWQEAHPY